MHQLNRASVILFLLVSICSFGQSKKTVWDSLNTSGVWETKNAGITFKPIFDGQKTYSIGCITIDENSGNIWVGTGENVGGRHISYGDGVYLSKDGGATWKNMGLEKSEHISKIIVHPTNPDIVWVASQGPLWNSGGERGVYKTTDGGKKWKRTLGDAEWTGATDLLIDPRNPDVLYAATWQRHRTVASYLGGGPKSGIHKSTNGGKDWEKLKTGLPGGNMGKIGLAISPQNPDVLYAAIELDLRKGGFYRSSNKGASWTKQSDAISGGTGPHYYQEIYASPHQFDRVYIVYAQSQQGYFTRLDMETGERVAIRPQPGAGEKFERYNWDAPILVSSHDPKRVYVASYRLWRSDDRGDSWEAKSEDLTRNEERFDLPIMGRKQSFNNPWDVYAMSTYNTITSIAESPKNENVLYIGTDDGFIQSTEDGGQTWNKINVKKLPGAPERAYVNDIKADLFDENTVYVALDNHKSGDYKPYLYVSKNRGKSWKSS